MPVNHVTTKSEAIVAIVTALPTLSEEDVRGFLACTDDERALIVQSLQRRWESSWSRRMASLHRYH